MYVSLSLFFFCCVSLSISHCDVRLSLSLTLSLSLSLFLACSHYLFLSRSHSLSLFLSLFVVCVSFFLFVSRYISLSVSHLTLRYRRLFQKERHSGRKREIAGERESHLKVPSAISPPFLKPMCILSDIQFTRHSIEFLVAETKQLVGSR